jgi:predicted TIM-barrel fold metal-dependent hydrolase
MGEATLDGAISADSHVLEPAGCYVDNVEAKYRDRAPKVVTGPKGAEYYVIDGRPISVPLSKMAAAGMDLLTTPFDAMTLEETCVSAYDPKTRLADQAREGVAAEILYPTAGMLLCAAEDADYKQACMWAYNRWLRDYVAFAPDRLFGLGMSSARSPAETVKDLQAFKDMGFVGVMLPCEPSGEDQYWEPAFDPVWATAAELGLPVSFHLATGRAAGQVSRSAGGVATFTGPMANSQHDVLRANQDIIGTFIWGGMFERHPKLKLVCVEADASWAPHLMSRMDYIYVDRADKGFNKTISQKPSAYFLENVYFTLQNDWLALRMLEFLNLERLLWSNDFPHSDGAWPNSRDLLDRHAGHLSPAQRHAFLRGNTAALYGLAGAH